MIERGELGKTERGRNERRIRKWTAGRKNKGKSKKERRGKAITKEERRK